MSYKRPAYLSDVTITVTKRVKTEALEQLFSTNESVERYTNLKNQLAVINNPYFTKKTEIISLITNLQTYKDTFEHGFIQSLLSFYLQVVYDDKETEFLNFLKSPLMRTHLESLILTFLEILRMLVLPNPGERESVFLTGCQLEKLENVYFWLTKDFDTYFKDLPVDELIQHIKKNNLRDCPCENDDFSDDDIGIDDNDDEDN